MFITNVDSAKTAFELSKKLKVPLIFPTDTIFGIGAPVSNLQGNIEVFNIKKRPTTQKLPILVANIEQLNDIAIVDKHEEFILNNYKLPYTFILKAKSNLNDFYKSNDTIAVRVPNVDWIQSVLLDLKEPITATSVNFSGDISLNNFDDIFDKFNATVSIFINGLSKIGVQSEIYDLTFDKIIKKR